MISFLDYSLTSLEERSFSPEHRRKLATAKRGRSMPSAVRKKISNKMAGKSNFEGQKHTSKGKQNISDGRGHYDPIKGKKWYVNKHSGKTWRKPRNPTETIYQHGRIVRKGKGLDENFIDGRNPEDKGDSRRHGIPKKATLSLLKKIRSSKTASPRKKQLAHWQINMRQGRS